MKRVIMGSILLLLLGYNSSAQESRFKALFLSKFVEYVSWPNDTQDQVIGVFGESEVYDALVEMSITTGIKVIQILQVNDYNKCDMIYVPESMKLFTPKLKEQIGDKSVLVISDVKDQVGSSADIGFFIDKGRLMFFIDADSIRSKNMTPNARIIKLGAQV
ncbi:MAG: YfiR family protein [Reichenbachiella sp.]